MARAMIYDNPTSPGWYATVTCWDSDEGGFPGAYYWTGETWENCPHNAIISYCGDPFPTEREAVEFAYENDLGF